MPLNVVARLVPTSVIGVLVLWLVFQHIRSNVNSFYGLLGELWDSFYLGGVVFLAVLLILKFEFAPG